MRIRTVKPEFWRSDDVASLPIADRLLFVGLWSYVDDSGVGVDKLAHICADLFAPDLERNPTEVFGRVQGGLQKLHERGMIIRYEAEGKNFIYITNWKSHQRIDKPSRQRYPLPDVGKHLFPSDTPEDSGNTPEEVATGTEEQRNRGKNTPSSPATPSKDFDEFWAVYPKKVAKQAARKAWDRVVKKTDPQAVILGAKKYAVAVKDSEQRFIKSPDGWINSGRWEDETAPVVEGAAALVPAGYAWANR